MFVLAAVAEIGGTWLVWQACVNTAAVPGSAPRHRFGIYGLVAPPQPDADFGRILAAYRGVFVAGSLLWGMSWTDSALIAGTSLAPSSAGPGSP